MASANASPRRVFVVRHGRSAWNKTKRITGQLDPPLARAGHEQAQALSSVLADEKLAAIYTSTLQRAVATAEPTASRQGIPINRRSELMEINLGVLQGRYRDERDPEACELWRIREANKCAARVPGGESFAELEARVVPCLADILRETNAGAVLLVGHRSTNRVLLGTLMRWNRELWAGLNLRSKFVYEVTLTDPPRVQTICLSGSERGVRKAGFIS